MQENTMALGVTIVSGVRYTGPARPKQPPHGILAIALTQPSPKIIRAVPSVPFAIIVDGEIYGARVLEPTST